MADRGYDDRPVTGLTADELLEQALQSAYDSGHYAATDQAYSFWHKEAIDRRDACFGELRRRLEATEALVTAAETVTHKIVATAPGMLDLRAALRPFRQEAHDGN